MNFTIKKTQQQRQLNAYTILKKNNHIGNIHNQSVIQQVIQPNLFSINSVRERERLREIELLREIERLEELERLQQTEHLRELERLRENNNVYETKKENESYENIISSKYNLNKNYKNVYIISNIQGGGSLKYIIDIINNNNYKNNFIIIKNEKELRQHNFCDSIILLQQLFYTDINLNTLINLKKTTNVQLIISIHDCYWINDEVVKIFNNTFFWHNAYLKDDIKISEDIIQLFEIADEILFPSKFIYGIYSKYFSTENFVLVTHNDYFLDYSTKNIPLIKNNNINIGVFHDHSIYKGKEYINYLSNKFINYKDYTIKWHITGVNSPKYKEKDFFKYIKFLNIHCLTSLNKEGETWSYALTKFINSGLPIIYNNFGAFKERIPDNVDHYFKVYETEMENDINNEKLDAVFIQLLDYIIQNNGEFNNINTNTEIIYNPYYNNLFNNKKYDLNLFAVYFPQFHNIIENDINYYKGYNDIKNLKLYLCENTENSENLDTPLLSNYNIDDIELYDLENNNIINKQVDIAQSYGLKGFAIYYYWFSKNTITNSNTIMENGYKGFFDNSYDSFKVFFIWANENWSDNVAFNVDNKNKIINEYNKPEFEKNSENLISYFKHKNYYKIDNKPVFSIHHPWFITNEQIDLFFDVLNNLCIQNSFDGVHLIINSMGKTYTKYKNYDFHPNYKNPPTGSMSTINGKNCLDYEKYLNILNNNNNIDTLFFDFNNTARLYKPKKSKFVTRTINNTEESINIFINKIKEKYKYKFESTNYNEIDSIILINAWNEWGENMSIEPGNKLKDYYLNKIKELKSTFEL
jgi:hypothetical protein